MNFRVKIIDGESVTYTDWVEENTALQGSNAHAVQAVNAARTQFPNAALMVERDGPQRQVQESEG